jgi:hypothetical protein
LFISNVFLFFKNNLDVNDCFVILTCIYGWTLLTWVLWYFSKPRCVLLHSGKRARLPYDMRAFLERMNGTQEHKLAAQRNLAFLFAIQHGARFLMDWYFEPPFPEDTRAGG